MKGIKSYKDRQVKKYQRVSVHRNLRSGNGGLSIKSNNTVCGHADAVYLRDVKFNVSQSGNERVRREKQKNVHAHITGDIVLCQSVIDYESRCDFIERQGYKRVRYNPYMHTSFVYSNTDEPVYKAREAYIMLDRIYIK